MLLNLAHDPVFWLVLTALLWLCVLFATSLVRRRDPPLIVLLDLGMLFGAACYGFMWGQDRWFSAQEAALLASGVWLAEAALILLAAAIQPGARAPINVYLLTLHGSLAALWSLFVLLLSYVMLFYGILLFLFALCAARDAERSRAACQSASGLLAAQIALFCGYLLARGLLDRHAIVEMLLWASLMGAPLASRLSLGPSRDQRATVAYPVALVLLGFGVGFPSEGVRGASALAVELLRGPLPSCPMPGGPGYDPKDDRLLWRLPSLPVRVVAADDDLSAELSRPHDLLCSELGLLRYGTTPSVRLAGDGVAMRRVAGGVRLADGSPISVSTVKAAALACGIDDRRLAPDPRDIWPAAVIAERCRAPWICVAPGRVCDYDPARGFYLRE